MPLSAPARLRGSEPPEENPPRIIIVRPASTLVRQDSFVSIDIEDPDSVVLPSHSQESGPNPSAMGVVTESLGEPHPSSNQAAWATTEPTEAACKPHCRRTQSAEAAFSRTPFQVETSPDHETTTDCRQASGESNSPNVSISSSSVNEIREPEENEVQPGPSHSISSIEGDVQAQDSTPADNATPETETDSGSVSVTLKLNPKDANESLNASNTKKLNARMKRLLFGVESKKPKSEGMELHEIKSHQNLAHLDPDSTDCQPNIADSYKNLCTTARDLAVATTSFSALSPRDEEGGDDGPSDAGGDCDSSGAESSTRSTSRPRNWRMRGLVRMQMAARGMRDDARRNAFVGTLSVFQTIIQFGYYLGLIPFRVVFDGTKYVMQTSRPRQIIVFIMLLVVIWCEARKALKAVQAVNIIDYPGSLFTATEEVVRVWLLIAYVVVLYWKQSKFLPPFDDFTHDFRRPGSTQARPRKGLMAQDVALVFCCIYFLIANWKSWMQDFFATSFEVFLENKYNVGVDKAGLPDVPSSQVYFWIVSITFWAITAYSHVVKFYMEGMLWASAWTLYSIERKTRSYTMHDEIFEIKMGTETFRCVIKLVRDLNRALGPLRVVQFLVLIPYVVNIAYEAGSGHFDFYEIFQIPLQVGHFLVAAEASANMKNLIQHIVLFMINLTPEQRQNQVQWHELTVKQNFFAMIASTPIALEGMDFFEVSYVVLGNIAASVITYVLVILDWKRGP